MNSKYDITIIGGGAAGLFCAALIKSRSPELNVLILEKQDRVGKKLLVTGNGRCNLTNLYITPDMYHGTFSAGAEELLNACPPDMIVSLFEEFGLLTVSEDDGRVYPLSKQANSVLDVLRLSCIRFGVDITCDACVTDIKHKNQSFTIILSNGGMISSGKVVVATGSKSFPSTGADSSIFNVLKKLGHRIIPEVPSLCPVKVNSPTIKSLKGIRANGSVSLMSKDISVKTEFGEIQFTDTALSGICVFNLSRYANTLDNCCISISLIPGKSFDEVLDLLRKKKSMSDNNDSADKFFVGFFNKMIGIALLKEVGISPGSKIQEISDNKLKRLASVINDWRFNVIKSSDFTRSQVTAGGVCGDEISAVNMKSKIVNNLYIIGEAVDCDGDCGGMNLQFAFSSAYSTAMDLIK